MSANAQSAESIPRRPGSGPGFTMAPFISLSAAPTSVAVGDLNGDGKPDLVITTKSPGVTVLLGNGTGGFARGVEYPAGVQPGNALLADLRGDGKLDVVVTDSATGEIDVLFGNGDGTLGKPTSYAAIQHPVGLALGNFGGKGKIDLAVAGSTGVAVLLNDGSGHFLGARPFATGRQPLSLTTADLTGAGHDDLVLANQDGTVSVLLGDGGGNFHSLAASPVASGPLSAVVAGDFNGDGRADLAIAQANSNTLTVLLGRGDGTFQPGVSYTVDNGPSSVISADLNGDGNADLIAINKAANTFSVLLGNGDGTFRSAQNFVAGNSPVAAVAGDFNNDGHADLAIVNYGDETISVPLGRGDGTLVAARAYRAGLETKAIAAGDLNGDGLQDLVVTNSCGNDSTCASAGSATVFLASPDGAWRAASTIPLGNGPVAVALVDLSGDKKLDLLALNRDDKTLEVMPGNGDGTFGKARIYTLSGNPRALFVADFNGDGHPDVAIATDCGQSTCTQPGNLEVWLGRGDGALAESGSYAAGYSPVSIAAGDLRGTGHLDLILANACGSDSSCKSDGTGTLLAGNGTGKFTALGQIDLGNAPSSIALGNLSGNGLDLAVAERGSNQISVLHANGSGGFGAPVTYAVGQAPSALTIADLNGDGKQDVAVANFQSSTVSVLSGNGDGTLQPAVTYPVGAGPESLVAASPGKTSKPSLITADGNSGASPMGGGITELGDPGATPSATALTNSPISTTVDQRVTLTATVTGTAGTPTGTVVFYIGASVTTGTPIPDCNGLTGITLMAGVAQCFTQLLPAGTDALVAGYSGDSTYAISDSSGAPTSQSVVAGNTTVTVSPTIAGTVDQQVTLTATVKPNPIPTAIDDVVAFSIATMSFSIGGNPITGCTAVTVTKVPASGDATATCQTSALTAPGGQITAQYNSGDPNNNASPASAGVSQTINPANTSVTVNSTSPTSPTAGQPITITATVSPNPSEPVTVTFAETMSFSVDGSAIASCATQPVNTTTGVATCPIAAGLSVGAHQITAAYNSGDSNYNASAESANFPLTVGKIPTTVTVNSTAPAAPTVDQTVTVTATVAPTSGSATKLLAGSMAFSVDGSAVAACATQPVNTTTGVATCAISAGLTAAAHQITAIYSGDANYSGPTASASFQVTVGPAATGVAVTPASQSSTIDNSVTLTATVSPNVTVDFVVASNVTAITGSVAFSYGSTPIPNCGSQSATFSSATGTSTATCTTSALPGGSNSITAIFSPAVSDTSYSTSPASPAATVTESKASTSTALGSSGATNVNQSVTFTATVSAPAGAAIALSGSVTFVDNGTTIASCSAVTVGNWNAATATAAAKCTISTLVGGNHSITATYGNDSSYIGSNNFITQVVTAVASGTTLVSSSAGDTSTVNQSVTLTATVTPATSSVPLTGTATFADNGGPVSGCTVSFNASTGIATCTTTSLALGAHPLKATYAGDPSYTAGSGSVTQTVNQGSTTLALIATSNAPSVNQQVTLTATVTPSTSGSIALSGSVTFTDTPQGGTAATICSNVAVTPSTGVATCKDSWTAKGSHTITATYANDTSFAGSSNTASEAVGAASTSIALTSSLSPSTVNQSPAVAFTATITESPVGSAGLTGTVAFTDNGTTITGCPAVVPSTTSSNGAATATCTDPALTAAGSPHTIVATYANDPNFGGSSTNPNLAQTVNKAATSLALASSGSPSTVNQSVNFTATITPNPAGSVPLSGTVAFTDSVSGAISGCGSVPLTASGGNSVATCSTATLAKGTHTITATYGSDPNFTGSTNTFAQTVNAGSSVITLTSSSTGNASTVNQTVTFTASIPAPSGSAKLTGDVTFLDNATTITGCSAVAVAANLTGTNYTASCADASLTASASPHAVTATYSNDLNFTVGGGTLTQTVNKAATNLAVISGTNPSQVNVPVTFTATVTPNPSLTYFPSGTVAFTDSVSGAISGCGSQTVSTTAGQATCTTSALAVDQVVGGKDVPHIVTANYSGDSNFNTNTNTVSQTVEVNEETITFPATTPASSTVNLPVIVTADFAPPTSGTKPSGTETYTDNGTPIAGCTNLPPTLSSGTYVTTCAYAGFIAGNHTIVASYSGDINLSVISGSTTLKVAAANINLGLTSSSPTSVVGAPVTFAATVSPATAIGGPVLLSGAVTFTASTPAGAVLPLCPAVPVLPTSGSATCPASALPPGQNTITATYGSDPNFAFAPSSPATNTLFQDVQDFSMAVSLAPPVVVSQGFTTSTDPFTPQTVSVSPVTIEGYSTASGKPLNLTCAVTNLGSTAVVKAPACALYALGTTTAASTLPVVASGAEAALSIVVDASSSSATPGIFTVTVTGTDPTTTLSHSASFNVTVLAVSSPLELISGATTNNSGNVTFLLPPGVTVPGISCLYIGGTGISSTTASPAQYGVACTSFNPSSLGSATSTSLQSVTTSVTVTTNSTIAMGPVQHTGLLVAGLFGVPFFLIGLLRRRPVRSSLLGLVVFAALGIAALQAMGCGGSFHSSGTQVSGGTTPPGAYYLLVEGAGSDGNTYSAVLQLDVEL